MGITLTFEITLESDYHVGAGHGLGAGVDSALLRDRDGVPVLRGTMLAGLLRDALWRLIQTEPLRERYALCAKSNPKIQTPDYCGQASAEQSPVVCPICRIFGSPRQRKHWHITSARPEKLAQIGGDRLWQVGETGALLTRRARVSPRTRRAEDQKLFSQEEGDGQLRFRFSVESTQFSDGALDEAALLVAAARNVRELGRSRRRGRGECIVHLIEPTDLAGIARAPNQSLQDGLLDRFKNRWLDTPISSAQTHFQTYTLPVSLQNDARVRLQILARIEEPVLIAERAEAGNQFETISHISGSTLRGALAQIAAAQFDLRDETVYRDFQNIFLRGEVNFPALLPAFGWSGEYIVPTIPAPLNLMTCKTYPALSNARTKHPLVPVWDDAQPHTCQAPKCDAPLAPLKDFVMVRDFSADKVTTYKPAVRTEMHIEVEPQRGRVRAGALFGYAALDAGQYLMGELTCASESAWLRLQTLTGIGEGTAFPIRLGKATRRGYGRVTLMLKRLTSEPNQFVLAEQPIEQRIANTPPNVVMLTLLTDAIIYDEWGRASQSFQKAWLARELNLDAPSVELGAHFAATRNVDGFNDQVGLPRWRDLALQAGSSVALQFRALPDWEQLRRAESAGIGLRRNEGFGQIVFNHPVYAECHGLTTTLDLGELDLASEASTHPLKQSVKYEREWQKLLDALRLQTYLRPKNKMDEHACANFAALAAWLYAQRETALDNVIVEIKRLGKPSSALVQAIGEDEHGSRDKKTYWEKSEGAEARDKIIKLIERLHAQAVKYPPPARGLTMLAEQIAAQVAEARRV
jgi:CRISPR-associated protein Csx10